MKMEPSNKIQEQVIVLTPETVLIVLSNLCWLSCCSIRNPIYQWYFYWWIILVVHYSSQFCFQNTLFLSFGHDWKKCCCSSGKPFSDLVFTQPSCCFLSTQWCSKVNKKRNRGFTLEFVIFYLLFTFLSESESVKRTW